MPDETKSFAKAIQQALRLQPGQRVFGVVDGAQDLELALEAKKAYGLEITSFFEGNMAAECADVAPYVVAIDPASGYLENWARRWGKNAGILLTTSAEPAKVHAHLRQIFIVKDGLGQQYFFRYYDPRVLRAYIPTCTGEELAAFFGPISDFLAEDETPSTLLSLRYRNSMVETRAVRLSYSASFAPQGEPC